MSANFFSAISARNQIHKRLGFTLLEEVLKQKMVVPNVLKMTGLMCYTTKDTSPDGELPPGLEKYGNSYNPRQSVVILFLTSNMDFDYHYIVTPPGEYPPPNAVLPLPYG